MASAQKAPAADAIRRYAAQFDVPGHAVIGTTAAGTIVYWSRGARELYGWDEDEVIGRDVLDVTPSAPTRETAEAIMSALQNGRSWSGQFMVRRRDGVDFLAEVRDLPVRDDTGALTGIIGVSMRADAKSR